MLWADSHDYQKLGHNSRVESAYVLQGLDCYSAWLCGDSSQDIHDTMTNVFIALINV